MAFIEFWGSRKLRIFGMGRYTESDNRMNRRKAELYCIAHGLRFAGFEWHWQVYVGVRNNKNDKAD